MFGSLVELHAWLHSYLCISLLEKLFLSSLNTSTTPLDTWLIYQTLQLVFIAISIAPRQLCGLIDISFGSSIASPSSIPKSSKVEDEDDDDDATASEDDDDEDASSSNTDEMSTWHSYPLSLVTKRGSSFGYKSTHT